MCTTYQDQCPVCHIWYLNHPLHCASPHPPSCLRLPVAPKAFMGLPSPHSSTRRTRWCDGCILRMRKYCEILDFQVEEKQKLDGLYAMWLETRSLIMQEREEVVTEQARQSELDWGQRMANEALYLKLKRSRRGLPDWVAKDEEMLGIEERILEGKMVVQELELRMEVRMEELLTEGVDVDLWKKVKNMDLWKKVKMTAGFSTRGEWQCFRMGGRTGENV